MKIPFDFECLDCFNTGIDSHGRCVSCGSGAVAVPDASRHNVLDGAITTENAPLVTG